MDDRSINLEILHQLRQCGHFLHQMMGDGKASQSRVLHILNNHESITQSGLQEMMGIRQSSMSELVQKLEEQNLITRVRDNDDRRQIQISLTDAGREELRANDENRSAHARELLKGLTGEEQAQLSALLEKLLTDWEGMRNPEGKQRPHGKHPEGKGCGPHGRHPGERDSGPHDRHPEGKDSRPHAGYPEDSE